MKRILWSLLLLLAAASCTAQPVFAAMSVTWTTTVGSSVGGKNVWIYSAAVTSAADGTASGTISTNGYLVKIVTNPGATAPTADYDCVFNDADGADVTGGALANRHTSTTQLVFPMLSTAIVPGGVRVDGTHTLSCSAMGDTKDTVIRFTVQE
jgi:hypothetical protein